MVPGGVDVRAVVPVKRAISGAPLTDVIGVAASLMMNDVRNPSKVRDHAVTPRTGSNWH